MSRIFFKSLFSLFSLQLSTGLLGCLGFFWRYVCKYPLSIHICSASCASGLFPYFFSLSHLTDKNLCSFSKSRILLKKGAKSYMADLFDLLSIGSLFLISSTTFETELFCRFHMVKKNTPPIKPINVAHTKAEKTLLACNNVHKFISYYEKTAGPATKYALHLTG